MAHEIFTQPWAESWADEINENEEYRKAAANWEGAIALKMTADLSRGVATDRAVVADLWHGSCRGATAGDAEAVAGAPYVIRAAPETWKDVLEGRIDPLFGLMRGKLKLERGGLFSLLPYAVAAKELVASAGRVVTSFPPGWE